MWADACWEEAMWGHGAKSQPQHRSPEELFFIMEMQGLINLSLSRQGRKKPPYAELGPKPFWQSIPRGQGFWDIISAAREEKLLEVCTDLAEIPGDKAASRENRVCYWHEGTNFVGGGILCSTPTAWYGTLKV